MRRVQDIGALSFTGEGWKRYGRLLMLALKVVILGATFIYLYWTLFHSQDFSSLLDKVLALEKANFVLLPVVSCLMIFNWGFEALKWKYLMKAVHPLTLKTAFMAVMSGVSASALLPNRIAEYLGRIFYIPPKFRLKAIIASLIGSFAQLLISLSAGSLAFVAYQYFPFNTASINLYILLILILALNVFLLLGYFNIPFIVRAIPQKGFLIKVKQYLRIVNGYRADALGKILLFSGMRYCFFVSQFYLLLYTFNVSLTPIEGLIAIPVVFLAQTLIPTIALSEIGIRGVTAVHFIGFYGGNEVSILAATYALWLINILFPALVGALFITFNKIPEGSKGAE